MQRKDDICRIIYDNVSKEERIMYDTVKCIIMYAVKYAVKVW